MSAIGSCGAENAPSRDIASNREIASRPANDGPNIVVIETDDQALNSFRRSIMPQTFRLLVDRGTTFTRSLAAPPLCCPSRAGFLTGQYPHNHGVYENEPGYAALEDPTQVLPAWLQEAGYRTALVGKFLNGTEAAIGATPAPGWDEWYVSADNPSALDPEILENGDRVRPKGHAARVLTQASRNFIDEAAGRRPFFLWLNHFAPHAQKAITPQCEPLLPQPSPQAIRDYDGPAFRDVKSPGFNERDISDKPSLEGTPRLSSEAKLTLRRRWRCAAASLTEVDRSVGEVAEKLRKTGEMRDTLFVFTSDNGFFFGEHRLFKGKAKPFDEAFRVPLAMRLPRGLGEAPAKISELVAQIDLPATFLELAGAEPCIEGECRRMDGRSLMPLLRGKGNWPQDRAVLLEVGPDCERQAGLRTPGWMLGARFGGCPGEPELYDMTRDPFQLENVAPSEPGRVADLRGRLDDLHECSGVEGRDAALPGKPFCE